MKKILLCSVLAFIVFSVFPKAMAQDTSMMNSIFKIQAYEYNKLSDMYVLKQYGSAVLIANNILLTNAHVITDDNNEPTLQYEACQTLSSQEAPKCFSTLQLLSYDKNSDLALLQIVNPSDTMPTPVTMLSGTLNVGDSVRIIGYPANGGSTITTTQWTIAWFESDYYKTDANIDEGNSWGGSFDNAGNFIGIPTFVVNGQTTLWYIIPTSTIKKFIWWEIGTTYKPKYSAVFDKRLKAIYAYQTTWIIDNSLFTTPAFTGWLTLDSALEKKNNNIYSYSLSNENNSTVNMFSLIATDNTTISRYISNSMKQASDSSRSPTKSIKKIGNTTRSVISFWSDTWVGYDYIQTTSTNKTYLEFVVLVDKEYVTDLPALIWFVENTTVKRNYSKPQVFNLPIIKLSSKWNVGIVKRIKSDGLSISILPTNGKYVSEINAYVWEKSDTLKSVTAQLNDMYDSNQSTTTAETSKYPSTVSVTRLVDENNNTSVSMLGFKKYGSDNIFFHILTNLNSTSAKQEVITLGYKILGLE